MKIERTTQGLREFLFKTLDDYNAGRIDREGAVATTKIINAIISTVNADLKAAQIMHSIKSQSGNEVELNLSLTDKSDNDDEENVSNMPVNNASYIHRMGTRKV